MPNKSLCLKKSERSKIDKKRKMSDERYSRFVGFCLVAGVCFGRECGALFGWTAYTINACMDGNRR